MVAHLRNIDDQLAQSVAFGLGLKAMPLSAIAKRPTLQNLPPAPSLSVIANGPKKFSGRKIEVLLGYGAHAVVFNSIVTETSMNSVVIVTERFGVKLSDGIIIAPWQALKVIIGAW